MAKFNSKTKVKSTKTTNLAGGKAYKQTNKLELASILLTSFVEDTFYQKAKDTTNRLADLIKNIEDKKFAAKASIYARDKFGMRSITHVSAGEVVKNVKGEEWTKNFLDKVVVRPDDMTEILSYYISNFGKPLPNSLKKGLAKAFNKFDEYSLGKYQGKGNDISLIDVVNLVHPKPTEKNANALKKLIKDELRMTDTWENKLSEAGQIAKTEEEKAELKKDAWKELISTKKIGQLALLRNLRNILQQAPETINDVIALLTDEVRVKKSRIFPFQYSTAFHEIFQSLKNDANVRIILQGISKALDISMDNVPKFKGNTLVAIDDSGSMGNMTDNKSAFHIGAIFAAILAKSNNADLMRFSNDAFYVPYDLNMNTLTILDELNKVRTGNNTNFHTPFVRADKAYDRIIILSDLQGWGSYSVPAAFNEYKKKFNCNPHIYSFDLRGYGTLQLPENQVYCLAGVSDKIFDIMSMLETDKNALINDIEKIEL